jgi:hypothetical protein
MTWFKDYNGHTLESRNGNHRLLYCQLCQKLVTKSECRKLRQNKSGSLYEVKAYHHDKTTKVERAERKQEKEADRLVELANFELNKIIRHVLQKE